MAIIVPITAPFKVRFFLYISPAVITNIPLVTKFANSPTNPVEVMEQCNKFFISSIKTPDRGPRANAPIRAGRSENSMVRKPATSRPIALPINCSKKAMADNTPIFTKVLTFLFFICKTSFLKKIPEQCSGRIYIYSAYVSSIIQTLTVGFGISPNQQINCSRALPPVRNFTDPRRRFDIQFYYSDTDGDGTGADSGAGTGAGVGVGAGEVGVSVVGGASSPVGGCSSAGA